MLSRNTGQTNKPEHFHMTEQEIADELGLSRMRVKQILEDALHKIRLHAKCSVLRSYHLNEPSVASDNNASLTDAMEYPELRLGCLEN